MLTAQPIQIQKEQLRPTLVRDSMIILQNPSNTAFKQAALYCDVEQCFTIILLFKTIEPIPHLEAELKLSVSFFEKNPETKLEITATQLRVGRALYQYESVLKNYNGQNTIKVYFIHHLNPFYEQLVYQATLTTDDEFSIVISDQRPPDTSYFADQLTFCIGNVDSEHILVYDSALNKQTDNDLAVEPKQFIRLDKLVIALGTALPIAQQPPVSPNTDIFSLIVLTSPVKPAFAEEVVELIRATGYGCECFVVAMSLTTLQVSKLDIPAAVGVCCDNTRIKQLSCGCPLLLFRNGSRIQQKFADAAAVNTYLASVHAEKARTKQLQARNEHLQIESQRKQLLSQRGWRLKPTVQSSDSVGALFAKVSQAGVCSAQAVTEILRENGLYCAAMGPLVEKYAVNGLVDQPSFKKLFERLNWSELRGGAVRTSLFSMSSQRSDQEDLEIRENIRRSKSKPPQSCASCDHVTPLERLVAKPNFNEMSEAQLKTLYLAHSTSHGITKQTVQNIVKSQKRQFRGQTEEVMGFGGFKELMRQHMGRWGVK